MAVLCAAAVSQLTLFTACTDAMEQLLSAGMGDVPVGIGLASGDGSRRATQDHHTTAFVAGDTFTAWMPEGATVQSAVCTVGTTVTQASVVESDTNRQPYFLPGVTSVGVRGYHPVMVPLAPQAFTVRTNQHEDQGFRLSDLAYASEKNATRDNVAALVFVHRMARLRVNVAASDAGDVTRVDIIGGAYRTVSLSVPETLTPGVQLTDLVTDTDAGRVRVWEGTATTLTADCLLPPQRIGQRTTATQPEPFLRLTTDAGNVTFTIDARNIESNKTYVININNIAASMVGKTIHLGGWDSEGTVSYTPREYANPGVGIYNVGTTTFQMKHIYAGSNPGGTNNYIGDSYWMGETEVTSQLWAEVNGSSSTLTTPATGISKATMQEWIDKLNTQTASQRPSGYVFCLPSQEQWRFAFKGGIHCNDTYTYSGGSDIGKVAWYSGNVTDAMHIAGVTAGNNKQLVAQKRANQLGLYDMSGNVWEVVSDFGTTTYPVMYEGGGWQSEANYCDGSISSYNANGSGTAIGFRLALVKPLTDATVFNTSSEKNPQMTLDSDQSTLTVTRPDGVIDLNGKTVTSMKAQNATAGKTLTLRNGTIKGFDPTTGFSAYPGTIVMENINFTGEGGTTFWTDGHQIIFISGTYAGMIGNDILNTASHHSPADVVIYGGSFNAFKTTPYSDTASGTYCQLGTYLLYGGKYKFDPSAAAYSSFVTIASGYSVKPNTGSDSTTYPYVVSKD